MRAAAHVVPRTFTVPPSWRGQRLILNFGAVDYDTTGTSTACGGATTSAATTRSAPRHSRAARHRPAGDRRRRVRPDRYGRPADRQAANGTRAAIFLNGHVRICRRCGWSRCPATTSRRSTDARRRRRRLHLTVHAITARAGRRVALDGAIPVGRWSRRESAADVRIPHAKLWSPRPPFLYTARHRRRRPGRFVLRHALDGQARARTASPARPERPADLRDGHAGSGLLAGRHLHRPDPDAALRFDLQAHKDLGSSGAQAIKSEPARWYYWATLGLLVSRNAAMNLSAPAPTASPIPVRGCTR